MKSLYAVIVISLATLGVACASSSQSADENGSEADIQAAARLSGTFDADGTNNLGFGTITFNSDQTYEAQGGCPTTGTGAHCFAISLQRGTFELTKSGPQLGAPGGAAEVVLTDGFGQKTTLFYTLSSDGSDLVLSKALVGDKAHFKKGGGPDTTDGDQGKLVGAWSAPGDSKLTFWALTLGADGTFSARGGCRPADHCFAITQQSGSWKIDHSGSHGGAPAGAAEIVLTDTFNQTTSLFYTLDASGKSLALGTSLTGERSQFDKN